MQLKDRENHVDVRLAVREQKILANALVLTKKIGRLPCAAQDDAVTAANNLSILIDTMKDGCALDAVGTPEDE